LCLAEAYVRLCPAIARNHAGQPGEPPSMTAPLEMTPKAVNNSYFQIDPEFMIVPGLAIFLTVMAFNLFGDGLRDALDPRNSR
jgi:hypothetical protein